MKKFVHLFAPLFISSFLLAQAPEWYSSHQHPKYPGSAYIIGVGTAPNGATGTEAAKKSALSDIASQLRVQVQSEMKSVTQNFSVNDDEQIYSDFKRQSRTMVNDEITGAEVAETATDEQTMTTYALLVLNRDKYCSSLRSELESGWKQAADLRMTGKDFAGKGRLNEAIQSINQIKQVIAPLLAKQVMHNAAARAPFAFPSVFNPAALQTDIREMLTRVKVEKKSGDDQKGKIGEKFAQPFVVSVSVNGVPCSGVNVKFMIDEKNQLGEGTTDDKGLVSFSTIVRSGNGIKAVIALAGIGREFEQNLASSAVTFSWSAQASDKAFSISVNEKNKKLAEVVSGKFSAAVSQIGYKVVTMAKNAVTIELSSGVPGKIEGMGGTLYSVTLEATASLKDNSANAVLGTAKFTSKGVGASEEEAVMKAAGGLKIDQKDLSELLQR
ncbi:MAG: LPP20 family lipoprotein [Bacteroidota bacterium]